MVSIDRPAQDAALGVPCAALPMENPRDSILRAARALFARRGYSGASIDEIARIAGLNKASLFAHFVSKDALYLFAVEESVAELRRAIEAASTEQTLEAAFRSVERQLGHGEAFLLCMRELFDGRAPTVAMAEDLVALISETAARFQVDPHIVLNDMGAAAFLLLARVHRSASTDA